MLMPWMGPGYLNIGMLMASDKLRISLYWNADASDRPKIS
jgi:hypothetical protein